MEGATRCESWGRCSVTSVTVALPLADLAQELAGVGLLDAGHLLGGDRRHQPPAGIAPLGAQGDDPVGRLDHVQVVLDDRRGVARFAAPVQGSMGAWAERMGAYASPMRQFGHELVDTPKKLVERSTFAAGAFKVHLLSKCSLVIHIEIPPSSLHILR